MLERDFLNGISRVYQGARDSDDGARCMVAPHPDLRARIKSAIAAMAATGGLPPALHLRAAEPSVLGLNDGVIIPPEEFAAGTSPSVIRSAAARAAGPLRGTVRVIVVIVDFSDQQMVQTRQPFQDLFFSLGQPKKSVREYYRDVTHGLIDLQGDVIGPLRLPQTVKTYANGASGMGRASPNAQTMAFDAVSAADPVVDFTPFDNDGNGFVDAFIVIHAGSGGEVTGSSDDIWSHKWGLPGGASRVIQDRGCRARARASAVRLSRSLRHRFLLRRHRQLVPDGGRKLGRRRRRAGASVGLVQGQSGMGGGERGQDQRRRDDRGREDLEHRPSSVEERHGRQ